MTSPAPLSEPATDRPEPPARRFNTRVGLILFTVYLFLYAGFVLLNAFWADVMETIVLAGLNLAIVYGFGLIIAAVILALIYGVICRSEQTVSATDLADIEAADGEDLQ